MSLKVAKTGRSAKRSEDTRVIRAAGGRGVGGGGGGEEWGRGEGERGGCG